MNAKFWRVQQYDAVGVFIKTIDMTAPIEGFPSLRVRGDGSCEEGSFTALVSALNINSRDILVIETSEDNSSWTPIYSGVVTSPGAKRSFDVSQVLMVGLSKRVSEVTVNATTYASDDLAVIVRTIAQAFLPDGVIYDAALIPTVNFTQGAVTTQYNYLSEVLDGLAASAPEFVVPPGGSYTYDGVTYQPGDVVPAMTWGVLPNRKLFFKRVRGSTSFVEEQADVRLTYEPPSAEDICTQVVAYGVRNASFTQGVVYNNAALQAQYGKVTKILPVALGPATPITTFTYYVNDLNILLTAFSPSSPPGTSQLNRSTDSGANWSAWTTGSESLLRDSNDATGIRQLVSGSPPGGFSTLAIVVYAAVIDLNATFFVDSLVLKGTYKSRPDNGAAFSDSAFDVFAYDANTQIASFVTTVTSPFDTTISIFQEATHLLLRYQFPQSGYGHELILYEARPTSSAAVLTGLDRVAESFYKGPVIERVVVEQPGIVPPTPLGRVTFLDKSSVTLDLAEVDYSITTSGGFLSNVNLGQGVNAELLAQAALITRLADSAERGVFDVITRNV